MVQAPAPSRLIEGGLPTEALVAHVVVGKNADHLPLYRQAQIYTRQGIELDRSTLADWVGRAARFLRPLHLASGLYVNGVPTTRAFVDRADNNRHHPFIRGNSLLRRRRHNDRPEGEPTEADGDHGQDELGVAVDHWQLLFLGANECAAEPTADQTSGTQASRVALVACRILSARNAMQAACARGVASGELLICCNGQAVAQTAQQPCCF